jgi:hypothetical protein
MTAGCHFRFPNALQHTGSGSGKSRSITATIVPSFCSIGTILPSRPARSRCRRAQRLSRMARLRATAPAARSVLDGREHDGTLGRVGKPIHAHQTDHQKVRVKHHQKACSRLAALANDAGKAALADKTENCDLSFLPKALTAQCQSLIESYHEPHGYGCLPNMLWKARPGPFIQAHRELRQLLKKASTTRAKIQ